MNPSWLDGNYQQLNALANERKLHHGLLLQGKKGIGKQRLALAIAKDLLCMSEARYACGHCKSCLLIDSQTHPDYLYISPEKDSISIEQIRLISDFFVHSASYQGAKVVVVNSAHSLTLAASNALLKTLEEPSENRFIILLGELTPSLPATILSRCFKLQLRVDQHKVLDYLNGQGVDTNVPYVVPFLPQPLLVESWQHNGELETVEKLFAASKSDDLTTQSTHLVDIFTQNYDYIDIFVQFLAQRLQADLLQKVLNIKQYEKSTQALLGFSSKIKEVKGLNMSLQLNALLLTLSLGK